MKLCIIKIVKENGKSVWRIGRVIQKPTSFREMALIRIIGSSKIFWADCFPKSWVQIITQQEAMKKK